MLLVWVQTRRHGAACTPDSVAYVVAARHLLEHGSLIYLQDLPFTGWPPLYPTVLAAAALGGIDPLRAAPYVNAGCIFGLLFVIDVWIIGALGAPALRWIGRGLLLTSTPLFGVARYAWSETLFVLLVMLALFALDRWSATRRPWPLALCTGLCALASLTRYIGPAVGIACALVIVLQPGLRLWRRIMLGAAVCGLAALPLMAWMIRNLGLDATLSGPARRPFNLAALADAPGEMSRVVAGWIWPWTAGPGFASALTLLFCFVVGRALAGIRCPDPRRKAAILATFTAVYLVCIAFTASMRDPISDRFLCPIVPPLICLVLLAADEQPAGGRRAAAAWTLGLALLFTGRATFDATRSARAFGAGGYACSDWVNDALVRSLLERPLEGIVICNDPYAYIYFTGRPCRIMGGETLRAEVVEASRSASAVHLVWFTNSLRAVGLGDASLEEAQARLPLRREYACAGGSVWVYSAGAGQP